MATTILSVRSTSLTENDEGKNVEVPSDIDMDDKNNNLAETSSLLEKKERDGNSFDVVTARNEIVVNPEGERERLNETETSSSTISQHLETSLKIEQAKIESEDDSSSKLFIGSNTGSLKNEDDCYVRNQMLTENLNLSEIAPHQKKEVVEVESLQQNKRDNCQCEDEEADDDSKEIEMEDIVATTQPAQGTEEKASLSNENKACAQRSEDASTKIVDPGTDIFEKVIANDQPHPTKLKEHNDVEYHQKPRDEEVCGDNELTTVHRTELFHATNDPIRDVGNTFADSSPKSDSKVAESIPVPIICDQNIAIELEFQTEQNSQLGDEEVETKSSFQTHKSTNQTKIENSMVGEQHLKVSSVIDNHEFHSESSNYCKNDIKAISSEQNTLDLDDCNNDDSVESFLKESTPKQKTVLLPENPYNMVSTNEFNLDDLEALLQFNPSSVQSQEAQSLAGAQNSELAHLEDLLRCPSPSRIPPTAVSKDKAQNHSVEIQIYKNHDTDLKNLPDLLHDSIPSRIESNRAFDCHVSIEKKEIQPHVYPDTELKRLEDLLLDSTPCDIQSNTSIDTQLSKKIDELQTGLGSDEDLKYAGDEGCDSASSKFEINTPSDDYISNDHNHIQDLDQDSATNHLSDLQLESAPVKTPSSSVLNYMSSEKKYEDLESESLEDLSFDLISSKTQPNSVLNDPSPSKNTEFQMDIKSPRSSRAPNIDTTVPEQMVSTSNNIGSLSKYGHPSKPSNYVPSEYNPKMILPQKNRLFGASEAAYKDEKALEEGQQSIFSDATSGQEYLKSMSNAKKQLKDIENEIYELKGIDDSFSDTVNRNSKYNEKKAVIPPSETNSDFGSAHSQTIKKKKSIERNRGMELPTPKQGKMNDNSSRTERKKEKVRRKSSKRNQVRPEKGSRKSPMEPDGDVNAGRRYRHKKFETSRSSGKIGNAEQNPGRNDPPMMIRGNLEVDGSRTYWNGDHLSIEKKPKRKKKHGNRKSRDEHQSRGRADGESNYVGDFEDVSEVNIASASSSRMERGDERLSVPVNEVNADNLVIERNLSLEGEDIDEMPHRFNTKTSDDDKHEYDPWAEVPCSCCFRYLPHTLVVATTHAYRLDRADEKDRVFH